MTSNPTVERAREIVFKLNEFKQFVRKHEEDTQYAEWVEGLIDGARACLKVISND